MTLNLDLRRAEEGVELMERRQELPTVCIQTDLNLSKPGFVINVSNAKHYAYILEKLFTILINKIIVY